MITVITCKVKDDILEFNTNVGHLNQLCLGDGYCTKSHRCSLRWHPSPVNIFTQSLTKLMLPADTPIFGFSLLISILPVPGSVPEPPCSPFPWSGSAVDVCKGQTVACLNLTLPTATENTALLLN